MARGLLLRLGVGISGFCSGLGSLLLWWLGNGEGCDSFRFRGGFFDAANLPVHPVVLQRGAGPAEVQLHDSLHELLPAIAMTEGFPGANESRIEIDCLISIKTEAIALLNGRDVGRHGVHQTTYTTHDRNRAVAHRQQLADPAGFKA